MADREKVIKEFECAVRKAHGEGWDYVDGLTTEDGFKILELLKEQENYIPVSWLEQYTRLKCTESWHNMANAIIKTWQETNKSPNNKSM